MFPSLSYLQTLPYIPPWSLPNSSLGRREQKTHPYMRPDCGCDVSSHLKLLLPWHSCHKGLWPGAIIQNTPCPLGIKKKLLREINVIFNPNSRLLSIIAEKSRQRELKAADHRTSTVKSGGKLMHHAHTFACSQRSFSTFVQVRNSCLGDATAHSGWIFSCQLT